MRHTHTAEAHALSALRTSGAARALKAVLPTMDTESRDEAIDVLTLESDGNAVRLLALILSNRVSL